MNIIQTFSILISIIGIIILLFPKVFAKYLRIGNRAVPVYEKVGISKAENLTRIFGLIVLIFGVIIWIIF
ncbi:MAG: hypothetical protein WCP24_03640 [bacterium]